MGKSNAKAAASSGQAANINSSSSAVSRATTAAGACDNSQHGRARAATGGRAQARDGQGRAGGCVPKGRSSWEGMRRGAAEEPGSTGRVWGEREVDGVPSSSLT